MVNIFKIKREEWWTALVALLVFVALNVLTIVKYADRFFGLSDNYHKLFVSTFHVSGFDPLTYSIVSQWDTEYNVYRHPLLAFFMYLPNQLNQGLMFATGINFAPVVVGLLLVFCSFYSFLFLYRIFREVIGVSAFDSTLLSAFYFSFAYVMVSCMVPDHFVFSMMLLLMTLYICGICIKKGRKLKTWQTVLLFVFTAGTSLNNGVKTYLAALFTNGRRFFHPVNLVLGVVLPCALIWGFARWEYRQFVWPKEMARAEKKKKKVEAEHAKIYQAFKDTTSIKDSAKIAAAVKRVIKRKAHEKYVHDHKQPWNVNKGKPIEKGEFMGWTDISTSRWTTCVENLFGESLMLHKAYLLEDVLKSRPAIVKYQSAVNYVAEALILLLALLGIIVGWRSRFLWLTLSFFAFDMALHMGLGFGINEIYIMTAHYMFALPIAIAFLLRRLAPAPLRACRALLAVLTLYLWGSNLWLLVGYMC